MCGSKMITIFMCQDDQQFKALINIKYLSPKTVTGVANFTISNKFLNT